MRYHDSMPLEVKGEKPALSSAEREKQFEASASALEDRIGYRFQNRQLLIQALTSPGYAKLNKPHGASNQLLEAAGDRLLRSAIDTWIRKTFPKADAEQAAFLSNFLNSNVYFSVAGMRLQLDQCVRVAQTRREGGDLSFAERQERMTSDALEALVAALYQDGGRAAFSRFVNEQLLSPHDTFLAEITELADRNESSVRTVFRKLTHGRGDIQFESHNRRYHGVVVFDGKIIPNGDNQFLYNHKADAAAYAVLHFFKKHPWVLWHFDGQASLIMPRVADAASVYGEPLANQARLVRRTHSDNSNSLTVRPHNKTGAHGPEESWKLVSLPPVERGSNVHHGSHLDQLRFELSRLNKTLTVRAPLHNPTGKQQYAFFANNELIAIITGAKSLPDAAVQTLRIYRTNNGM